jgi:EAL domain-containing protein (putative c-di-GMP-specific phosphodiesterase class I)
MPLSFGQRRCTWDRDNALIVCQIDMPTPHRPSTPKAQGELHHRRIQVTLWTGSALLVVLGIGWALFFVGKGAWPIVAVDVALVAVGVLIGALTRFRRTRAAFFLLTGTIWLVICGISLILDVPSVQAPRSTHLFLLLLAVISLLFLRDDRAVLRLGITGICLVTFVVLASTTWSLTPDYVLPDSLRIWGSWVNSGSSAIGIYVVLHVMVADFAEQSSLEADLERGLAHGEFFLVYQPQVTSAGQVTGSEALLRWRHPKLGMVPPEHFIALAERTGQILPLGSWVLEVACTQLKSWSAMAGMQVLTLSVNVSVHQFCQPDFVAHVADALQRTGAQAHLLKLELTESSLVDDMEDVITKMQQLKLLGVGFSLDDFGTGYSSLNYLKRLPLDQLKIDQSFVRDILTDSNDAAIARMIIGLGDSLQFTVIAEGVETPGQREFLIRHGCHRFQGYLFSKPISPEAYEQFVRATAERSV